jgi:hypothetical protein
VHHMIPLRDDRVVMPLGDVHAHRLTLCYEPFLPSGSITMLWPFCTRMPPHFSP